MDTGQNIVNMLKCRAGEHCLFRSFGLGQITDQVGLLRKAQITQALATWYPDVQFEKLSIKEGEYDVQVKEVSGGLH